MIMLQVSNRLDTRPLSENAYAKKLVSLVAEVCEACAACIPA
jgi:hypothetical protein